MYKVLGGDTSQDSIFFPDVKLKRFNNTDLSSKGSLTYRVSVNH